MVRVHDLVPKAVWSKRYDQINEFEQILAGNGTTIVKFFMLTKTSSDAAPWYVIPANQKWFRDLAVARVLADVMAGLKPAYPLPDDLPADLVIRDPAVPTGRARATGSCHRSQDTSDDVLSRFER